MATRTPEPTAGPDSDDGLPTGVIEELLDSPRRRQLLACLRDRGEPVAVADLAGMLVEDDASDERRRVRTEIYQEHLPKLTATGVVEFDSLLGTVRFTGPDTLATRLGAVSGDSRVPGTEDK